MQKAREIRPNFHEHGGKPPKGEGLLDVLQSQMASGTSVANTNEAGVDHESSLRLLEVSPRIDAECLSSHTL